MRNLDHIFVPLYDHTICIECCSKALEMWFFFKYDILRRNYHNGLLCTALECRISTIFLIVAENHSKWLKIRCTWVNLQIRSVIKDKRKWLYTLKEKSTSKHLFLVLQLVTNRGLYSVPGRTKWYPEAPWQAYWGPDGPQYTACTTIRHVYFFAIFQPNKSGYQWTSVWINLS